MTDPLQLHRPAGTITDGPDPVLVTPELAGWRYAGLRVLHLEEGDSRILETQSMELAVLPLSGACRVECEGTRFELAGRRSVFERVSDFAYVPMDAEVRINAVIPGDFALPAARAGRRLEPAYGAAEDVPVEVRGAGRCTRQVTNFLEPSAFPADNLVAVEVLTPAGNWSSYPPHKHDTADPVCGEAELEEIYYFRIRREPSPQPPPASGRGSERQPPPAGEAGREGFAVHRTYAAEGDFDVTATVRDGDVFLIPRGYHGPSAAAPGFDLYYLNVLAGPAEERTMAFCDDPTYAWIRASWEGAERDPRLPMTGPEGPRGGPK